LSGRGLCDELITRPEESYRLCCVVVCDLETSRMGAPYIYDISCVRVNALYTPRPYIKQITFHHKKTHPPTHLPTYLSTYLPTYLPTYLFSHSSSSTALDIQHFFKPCTVTSGEIFSSTTMIHNYYILHLYFSVFLAYKFAYTHKDSQFSPQMVLMVLI